MAQNTKETNGSTTSNPWFNYSHARSGVIMSLFRPHVHSICMRCINWPSMKWTTLHASNYHMGWILVQNCVRPCTHVCVQGNECRVACVHIFASCMYRQYGSGRTSTFFWNQQHVTVINPHKDVATTPPHVPRAHVVSWTVRETLCSVPLCFAHTRSTSKVHVHCTHEILVVCALCFYMWSLLDSTCGKIWWNVDDIQRPVVLGFAISALSD